MPSHQDCGRSTASVFSTKRQLDATIENDPSSNKRPRLTQTHSQQRGLQDLEQAAKDILQQPKPTPPQRPHATFLQDFVDRADPNRAEPLDTFVSEWIESISSCREKHCCSDGHLGGLSDEPISRQTTGSHSYQADTNAGSVAPSNYTRATTGSSRSSARSLVELSYYRDTHLAANNIYMRSSRERFPEHIADLVDDVRKERVSPGPSLDQVWQDEALEQLQLGAAESDVESYFGNRMFPQYEPSDSLKRTERQPMVKDNIPITDSQWEVSTPVPDMLYGYRRHVAFPEQQPQLISMGTEMVATNQADSPLYPFFVIGFKGDGGSMWAATNQCLGGAATCVNMAERLNTQLRNCSSDEVKPVGSAAFGVAMNGTEARLYISWKHDELNYYTTNIQSFLVQDPAHFIEFRKYVLNIIDWGKDRRLEEIRHSLNILLEEGRKRASADAKSRQPPFDDDQEAKASKKSGSSSSRRHKKHK